MLCLTGSHCGLIDFCASQPCRNNGQCIAVGLSAGYRCHCLPGFTGVTCTTNVNECARDSSICQNGGTCEDLYGSFRCVNLSLLLLWFNTVWFVHCPEILDMLQNIFLPNPGLGKLWRIVISIQILWTCSEMYVGIVNIGNFMKSGGEVPIYHIYSPISRPCI